MIPHNLVTKEGTGVRFLEEQHARVRVHELMEEFTAIDPSDSSLFPSVNCLPLSTFVYYASTFVEKNIL